MVAVKTLKENASDIEIKDLSSELQVLYTKIKQTFPVEFHAKPNLLFNHCNVQVMKTLEPHVNVVRLLGCCTDKDPIFVILEYVNRGKLQDYLRNSRAER